MSFNRSIGTLPKIFIITAFVNFLVGAFFGGWMASDPSRISLLGSLHGEINPFGWLTLMIYGMTYAVLTLSTGFHPPRAAVGWIHWLMAELGVILLVFSFFYQSPIAFRIGLGFQAMAPVVFLGNLLSAVITGKKSGRQFPQDKMDESYPLVALKRSTILESSDRVGQRGTDVALMLYLVAVWWIWIQSWMVPGVNSGLGSDAARVLIYYGWIGGTIWSVGLHLLPRFAVSKPINAKMASLGQLFWFTAVLIQVIGMMVNPQWVLVTSRLLGIAAIYQGVLFMFPLLTKSIQESHTPLLPLWSKTAWMSALLLEIILGLLLVVGLDPLSLLALHLLFLGFATTLLYGVGYGIFPWIFGGIKVSPIYVWMQLVLSIIGVVLMAVAFTGYVWSRFGNWPDPLWLAIGGILAALGAFLFILQWPILVIKGVKE